MVPSSSVSKDDHCSQNDTILFWTSTFHYIIGNVAFTIGVNCLTNEDIMFT